MRMIFSDFKKIASHKSVHLLTDLNELEKVKEGRTILVKDHRTIWKGDRYEVRPIAVTDVQMFVVCPVCGEIHVHNLPDAECERGVLPCGVFSGSRRSHCKEHDHCDYDINLIIA